MLVYQRVMNIVDNCGIPNNMGIFYGMGYGWIYHL